LSNATVDIIDGIPVRFIDYDLLPENKRQTGRNKDLLDIDELEKLHGDE